MNTKEQVRYTDNPEIGELVEVSKDFLPRPEELVFRPAGRKVTIILSEDSIAYFKEHAARLGTSYQRMIRNLLDEYVSRMQQDDHKV
jgi:predicted DNA binding CopG/RHH family protein